MNADFNTIDPQNELSDLYTPDYREEALNEDRFEMPCMEDYQ